jgi:phosphodiesterase/alkaline phosphatase D-like protein
MSALSTGRKLTLAGLVTLGLTGATGLASPTASLAASAPVFGPQLPVGAITRTTATVFAELNPQESETKYQVLYGVSTGFGRHTVELKAGSGSSEETVDAGLTGLTPDTTYHYEFVATNAEGTTTGPEETFTTASPTPPAATTVGASNVTLTTATVSGTIDAEGLVTSYELDLGTDTTYGTSMYGEAGSSTEPVTLSVDLSNLAPGATYHYRIGAINSDGRAYGADQTFTTPAYDKPIVRPGTIPLLATPSIAFPAEVAGTVKRTVKKKAKHKSKRHVAHGKKTGNKKKK